MHRTNKSFCRGVFFELGHFDKHSRTTPERKARQGKNLRVFPLETLKNFILIEKLYPQMTTIRAFFLQLGRFFSNFRKRARKTSPPPPPSSLQLRACILYDKIYFCIVQVVKQAVSCKHRKAVKSMQCEKKLLQPHLHFS